MHIAYATTLGQCALGRAEDLLESCCSVNLRGQVSLLFTSPPFPLNRKKKYGNFTGPEYIEWLAGFAPIFRECLRPDGSIVIEMGNAWVSGQPFMSTLALKALLAFLERGKLSLCQQFVWHNPAKLPTPAQWVSIERIRVKDAFTQLWWMATCDRPKADNRRVLQEYSDAMKKLIASGRYNAGDRPSEHSIGQRSFLRDNGGAIPSNVLTMTNTQAHTPYLDYCKEHGLRPHPARMPLGLAEFFVSFLSDPGDLVLDPFAGSNTTGAAADRLGRRWFSIEADETYVCGSRGWFSRPSGALDRGCCAQADT